MEKPGSNNNSFSKKPKFTPSPYKIRNYTCRFCGRSFFNAQALGGHQNAHRRERDEVKDHTEEMRKMMMMACIGMPYMPLAYIESHGHQPQQIIVGQPMFSWTSPLSSSIEWPGIYRVHDGAPIEPVPEPSITNDVIDAQSQDDVHRRLQLDRFELPDLNLDPSTPL